jgi:signal peptidase I
VTQPATSNDAPRSVVPIWEAAPAAPTPVAASTPPVVPTTGEPLPVPPSHAWPQLVVANDEPQPNEDLQPAVKSPNTPGGLRQFVEGLVCLALAVVLFRTFHLEGYMISTGSMAPSLYGYHKRVVCPSCRYVFAHGVAYDASVTGEAKGDDFLGTRERSTCTCPNCGQYGIDVTEVPRNQGDQLLVHKHAYVFQSPHRWEVVVFRNPNDSGEAYVKRIVGLPNERLQVRGGDVYIDGRIERKDAYVQRAIRIPVYEHDFAPEDRRWHARWAAEEESGWRPYTTRAGDATHGFAFDPDTAAAGGLPESWLVYRHWIRAGGAHETRVPLDGWPTDAALPDDSFLAVRFDSHTNELTCLGAMTESWRDRLLAGSVDADFRGAVRELYERSHVSPVTDFYGYNRSLTGLQPRPVRDLMLTARLEVPVREGRVVVRMTDGVRLFDWVLDYDSGRTLLVVDEDYDAPVRTGPLPASAAGEPIEIEMSTFDRQVLVTAGGELPFDPWPMPVGETEEDDEIVDVRDPVRIRAGGGRVAISHLALYRDVHYTRGRANHGIDEPYALGPDEFFALGDNSPVSFDSRSWPSPAVPERLLLGKPLVVHLPSKPGRVRLGDREAHIRIPDFSRIRYVR